MSEILDATFPPKKRNGTPRDGWCLFFTFALSRFITSPPSRYLDELASATRMYNASCLFLNKEFHFSCDVRCVGVYFNERTWGKRNSIKVSYDGRSVTTHYHLFLKKKIFNASVVFQTWSDNRSVGNGTQTRSHILSLFCRKHNLKKSYAKI